MNANETNPAAELVPPPLGSAAPAVRRPRTPRAPAPLEEPALHAALEDRPDHRDGALHRPAPRFDDRGGAHGAGADEARMSLGEGKRSAPAYWLTRFLFLRMLGLVYTVAFAVVVVQGDALLGSPACCRRRTSSTRSPAPRAAAQEAFLQAPTLFWLGSSDAWLRAGGLLGPMVR